MIITLFCTSAAKAGSTDLEEELERDLSSVLATFPGFISAKWYTADDGEEIGVVRFETRDALQAWLEQPRHVEAQRMGPAMYEYYWVQSAETFREYHWDGSERIEGDLSPVFRDDPRGG